MVWFPLRAPEPLSFSTPLPILDLFLDPPSSEILDCVYLGKAPVAPCSESESGPELPPDSTLPLQAPTLTLTVSCPWMSTVVPTPLHTHRTARMMAERVKTNGIRLGAPPTAPQKVSSEDTQKARVAVNSGLWSHLNSGWPS